MTAIDRRHKSVRTQQVANAGRYQVMAKREVSAVIDPVQGIAARDFLHAANERQRSVNPIEIGNRYCKSARLPRVVTADHPLRANAFADQNFTPSPSDDFLGGTSLTFKALRLPSSPVLRNAH